MNSTLLLLAILGLAVGSFVNTLSVRLLREENVRGRSRCLKCLAQLRWFELIPVFSFLWQRGRCRACTKPIPLRYLLGEVFTAIVFVVIGWRFFSFPEVWFSLQNGVLEMRDFILVLELVVWLGYAAILIVFFETDLEAKLLPDRLMYPAIVFSIFTSIFLSSKPAQAGVSNTLNNGFHWLGSFALMGGWMAQSWFGWLAGALGASLLFFLISFVSRGNWMGWGDGKLVFLLGMMFGFPEIGLLLVIGFLLGGVVAIALLLGGRASRKTQVPFGPFLIAGGFIMIVWGNAILQWYFSLFSFWMV